ncbi:Forkhead box protein N3 [Amphibalanus amphitrite]|uniref:Forkhead box protein N3 n=1 Tax=Amphibalanus amphitrite TaxID=1232801 RepID=A0A6A4V1G0_AMPAM|nr:Forkhead box protein N3 [Amphibalanus amphitrite]
MAAGDLQMAGAPDAERDSPPPTKAGATFGFTPAQQMMFQSSNMNGQRVVMVTPEVARSLGLVSGAGTGSGGDGSDKEAAAAIKIEEESGDVSVSVMETEDDDGMIDPDQFLEVELASGKAEAVVDEDLTSLSWLHSKNLLKASDVKFRQRSSVSSESAAAEGRLGPMSAAPLLVEEGVAEHSEESPTSDYLEDVPDTPAGRGRAARTAAVATVGRNGDLPRPPQILGTFNFGKTKRHPPHLPYDPKVHVHFKPPFSFSCLIFMSIEDSPQKAMPVKEIYNWIQEYFPFYQTAPIGWKNSVRHNLSLNKCFRKIEKSPGPGKGSLWTVDPLYRPHLIQALKRSPCVQETPSAFGSRASVYRPWTAAATALSGPPQPLLESPRRGPARRPPPPPSPAPVETPGPGGDPRSTESLEAAAVAAVPVQHPPPPATPAQRGTPRRRGRGVGRPPGSKNRPKSDDGGPNPDLFPLLSRRLLSMKVVKRPRDSAGHDYGPVLVSPAHRLASGEPAAVAIAKRQLVVIRRSPEEEHTYAARQAPAASQHSELLLSDDEAFSDDSDLSAHDVSARTPVTVTSAAVGGPSPEDAGVRFVREGANLLLNLAGVPVSSAASPAMMALPMMSRV